MGRRISFYCDICEEEFREEELFPISLPCWSDVEDEEGRGCHPYICIEKLDICSGCLRKTTSLKSGYRGEYRRILPCPDDADVYIVPNGKDRKR